jgi:myosin heavy subunit
MILERIPSYSGHFQYGTNKVFFHYIFLSNLCKNFYKNNNYQQIFLRESLDQSLEKERVNVLISSVVKIQSQIRGYLARRRYHTILYNIIKIQSTYRAYRAKRDYNKIRNGIIKVQANFRMKRQKLEYQKVMNFFSFNFNFKIKNYSIK